LKLHNKFTILIFFIFSSSAIADYEVSTSSGISDGYKEGRIIYWDDIPYAQPPIKELRWKAPREINKPENRIIPKEDNYCVQRPSTLGGPGGEGIYVGTEDCLYLDIVAPSKKKLEQLPVMFWIHGGGNTSGLKELYDFSKMVKKHDVIIVRINYRLGPFGWFTHPSIQEFQSGLDKSSNFGTLDIIAALEWVQKNISSFGGNPDNVTIFGESAGGHNVYSLLVSQEASGLFHKAIAMSGYTTSIKPEDAYKQNSLSSTSTYSSSNVVDRILDDQVKTIPNKIYSKEDIRGMLLNLSTTDFFKYYSDRKTYEELPLLTADGIVIPRIGLRKALYDSRYINKVPTMAGSNRDEVKLWLASAEYFVDLDYSPAGSLLGIPKVVLKDPDSFEAFNYYRSSAWKIRGVDTPLKGLHQNNNKNLYSYRYDWDDHRKYLIADFKKLIGAAHATEIPLLAGNAKLVGGYPLSDLIYPFGISKFYLSRNMMRFWTNFAKTGNPGKSSNSIIWEPIITKGNTDPSYMILDNRKNLKLESGLNTFKYYLMNFTTMKG
jgi:para-nitrobenzyl esterase